MLTVRALTARVFPWLDRDILGPILNKELTLGARRGQTYILRSVYVLILTATIAIFWYAFFETFRTPRFANLLAVGDFGLRMVVTIGVFQFIALHLIAPGLTSTAINEEIRKQTLYALMMTPITSFQIVTEKLLSRMLTVILLVAASLPLLAMLRVFGGVEWRLVLALEGLTLCSSLFAAALCLAFSTLLVRNNTDPAAGTVLFLLLLYAGLPGTFYCLGDWLDWSIRSGYYFSFFNPFYSLLLVTKDAFKPGSVVFAAWSSPWTQCGLLLIATLFLMAFTAKRIRLSTLRHAAGESSGRDSSGNGGRGHGRLVPAPRQATPSRLLAWAEDYPLLWKDIRQSTWFRPWQRNLLMFLTLASLIAIYIYLGTSLREPRPHIVFIEVFFLLALINAATTPAATITRDKEARIFDMILLTSLSPREILLEKALSSLTAIFPWVGLLLFHLVVAVLMGAVPVCVALMILIILIGPMFFLICQGTYYSLRADQTKHAQSSTQAKAMMLWGLVPGLTVALSPFSCFNVAMGIALSINPFASAGFCLVPPTSLYDDLHVPALVPYFLWPMVSFGYVLWGIASFKAAERDFLRYTTEPDNPARKFI